MKTKPSETKFSSYFYENLWRKFIPLFFCIILLVIANINFALKYIFSSEGRENLFLTPYFSLNYFFLDYYVFFALFTFSLIVLLFAENFFVRLFLLIIGLAAASLMAYTTDDLFTIKLYIFCSWIFVLILTFPKIFNFLAACFCTSFFIFLQTPFRSILSVENFMSLVKINTIDIISFSCILFLSILLSYGYRFLLNRWEQSKEMADHINMVMTQMSDINNKLQQIAKTRGEEAAKNERMRITRDMHDSCGYTFVNIMSLMDAAESNRDSTRDEIDNTFSIIRNLASDGLKETRKTLHAIRDMESPLENSINAIYDIKKLFMQVTKINVEITTGNIKKDYGRSINAIIIHTMQEALTNSIRHGRASNIYISLWEDSNLLSMVVRDDGIGSKEIVEGIGLAGMKERLEKISGELYVSSPVEGGFKVEIRIPLTGQEAEKE